MIQEDLSQNENILATIIIKSIYVPVIKTWIKYGTGITIGNRGTEIYELKVISMSKTKYLDFYIIKITSNLLN